MGLRLTGDFGPVDAMQTGVNGKGFFVLDQHRAHNAGIVGATKFDSAFGDDAHFFMHVNEGEDGLGDGGVGQFEIGALDGIFHGIGEKFQLIDQMRKLRGLNLGEFQFPLGQVAQNFFSNGRGNAGRTVIDEFRDFRHGRNLAKSQPGQKAKFF